MHKTETRLKRTQTIYTVLYTIYTPTTVVFIRSQYSEDEIHVSSIQTLAPNMQCIAIAYTEYTLYSRGSWLRRQAAAALAASGWLGLKLKSDSQVISSATRPGFQGSVV